MTDKKKIRAEIERRRSENFELRKNERAVEDIDILSFIDSMPEGPANTNLEEEIIDFFEERETWDSESQPSKEDIARHFANWQKKIDADLGSPAYERGYCDGRAFEAKRYQNGITQEDYDLAKAAAYEAGKQVMKQQMMKDAAVDLIPFNINQNYGIANFWIGKQYGENLKIESSWIISQGIEVNKKVKLIIIKED